MCLNGKGHCPSVCYDWLSTKSPGKGLPDALGWPELSFSAQVHSK